MTLLLIASIWNACGWAGLVIYSNYFKQLTLAEFVFGILFGPLTLFVHCIGWLMVHDEISTPVIWRKK